MDLKTQLKALWNRATWTRTANFTLPGVLFEIQPEFAMVASLANRSNGGGQGQFGRLALKPLAPGALSPSPAGPAILDGPVVRKTLEELALAAGNGQVRVGLLVPDGVTRVGVFSFETLPASGREASTLIGWRMRENLPFPPEESRISYQTTRAGAAAKDAVIDMIALAIRSSVAVEFEELFEGINRSSVMVLPATMPLLALVPRQEGAGQLLVHVYANAATLAVVEGQRLRFWRTRDFTGFAPGEIFAQVAAEAARVVASTEDRLSLHLDRLWLCARPPATDSWTDELAQTLGRDVELLMPSPEAGDLLSGEESSLFRRYGAPLAGLVANEATPGST